MMRKLVIILFVISISFAQLFKPVSSGVSPDSSDGLATNAVVQMALSDDSTKLWLGTTGGISFVNLKDKTLSAYSLDVGRGGITAVATRDSMVFFATAIDSSTALGNFPAGVGLYYSGDNGANWQFFPQPVDLPDSELPTLDSTEIADLDNGLIFRQIADSDTLTSISYEGVGFKHKPLHTQIGNVTYDIALTQSRIWIAAFYGGIKWANLSDLPDTLIWHWTVLPTDEQHAINSEQMTDYESDWEYNLNQRGFSVTAWNNWIWCGTAGGVNMSWESTEQWIRHSSVANRLAGDFVVALGFDENSLRLFAACKPTDQTQSTALAMIDGFWGINDQTLQDLDWTTARDGTWGYNFIFSENAVYVPSSEGLLKSYDGQFWAPFPPISDYQNGEMLFAEDVHSAALDYQNRLWVGTTDGLAWSDDEIHWHILRKFQTAGKNDEPKIYAYPNPFSPTHQNQMEGDGFVRVQYHLEQPAEIKLEIYDFAMEKVWESKNIRDFSGDFSETWNGRNFRGEHVANGVYFCKLSRAYFSSDGENWQSDWCKVMVIK